MDTSKEYIVMCDCEEIQNTFDEPLAPELFGYNFYSEDAKVWLPRQDQIQEMMLGSGKIHQFLIKFFYWLTNEKWDVSNFTTAEQLWLAFYMEEKHDNMWDGKKWERHGRL